MASPSRSEIDATLVRGLIESQFPAWADLPVSPVEPGGWDNRTFRLGSEMSVRLPSHERYVPQVDKEHEWLPFLAPHLPVPIPVPLARGEPDLGYPWPWSVYRWLPGEVAAVRIAVGGPRVAGAVGAFLAALHRIETIQGPAPGAHNFFRGGSLSVYDAETRDALAELEGRLDTDSLARLWDVALESEWRSRPVWVHGDLAPSNLLVDGGELTAVIDFGCCAVGDPACDLVIAWTLFAGEGRERFRSAIPLDGATWERARGWALWKAVITLAQGPNGEADRIVRTIVAEHDAEARSPRDRLRGRGAPGPGHD